MNLRLSHKMHPLQLLVSWKGLDDPSPGDFSYGADPDNLMQRFIWHGSRPYQRSPVWTNYLQPVNYMDGISKPTVSLALHHAGDEVYMSFGMPTGSFILLVRMEIDYSGKKSSQFASVLMVLSQGMIKAGLPAGSRRGAAGRRC